MAAVFYCRLIPGINLDALSYVAGVTRIATWRFALATFGALLPYTILLVAIGNQLVQLGPTELIVVLLCILFVSAIPMLWRYRSRRHRRLSNKLCLVATRRRDVHIILQCVPGVRPQIEYVPPKRQACA